MFFVMRRMLGVNGVSDKFYHAKTFEKAESILLKEKERLQENFVCGTIKNEKYQTIYQLGDWVNGR